MKKRVDQLLVEKGLCPSRSKAKELIEKGLVSFGKGKENQAVKSASQMLDSSQVHLEVQGTDFLKYVSRSGHKLAGALQEVQLDVRDFNCLDIGASTGGFTDCLLQEGAASVTCIDVGRGQLHPKIQSDVRVQNFESLNAKELAGTAEILDGAFDLVVIDVSFISVFKILNPVLEKLKNESHLLSLIKPQFEVGSVNIGKGGLVKSDSAVQDVLRSFQDWASSYQHVRLNLSEYKIFPASLAGRDGNQEYFLFARFTPKENQ